MWGLREGSGVAAPAQAPAEWRTRYGGGPVPAAPPAETPEALAAVAPLAAGKLTATPITPPIAQHFGLGGAIAVVACHGAAAAAPPELWGVVTDSISGEGLPGVTVLLPGTQIGVSTGPTGEFAFLVPAEQVSPLGVRGQVSSIGYVTQRRVVTAATAGAQTFRLQNDVKGLMGEVAICQLNPGKLPPAPWHPRRFYHGGKHWLTRPFHRG